MKTRCFFNPSHGKGLFLVCLFLSLMIFLPLSTSFAQVAEWTFENITSAVPNLPIAASSSIPQVSAAASIAGGNNNGSPDLCSGNETWSTNFWPTGNSRSDNEYLEFTVRADPGESVVISYFSFSSNASSANSALNFEVYYSKNNFSTSTFLFTGVQSTGSCTSHSGGLSTTLLPGSTIRFRVYPYGQNVAAQAATIRLDNVSIGGALLPVALTSFSAVEADHQILLQWTTATELNNDYFLVERSPDGLFFKKIGSVPGAGNSQTKQQYYFRDQTPLAIPAYYRLRQIDFDGAATVHSIIQVDPPATRRRDHLLTIWPTVVQDRLQVKLNSEAATGTLSIWTLNGRLVRRLKTSSNDQIQQVTASDLQSGWYVIQYRDFRDRISRRFFKQ